MYRICTEPCGQKNTQILVTAPTDHFADASPHCRLRAIPAGKAELVHNFANGYGQQSRDGLATEGRGGKLIITCTCEETLRNAVRALDQVQSDTNNNRDTSVEPLLPNITRLTADLKTGLHVV